MKIWIASMAAVAVQPLVLAARFAPDLLASPPQPLNGLGFVLLAVVAVAAAMTLLVGIPAFLVLHRFRWDGWTSLGLAGFLIGALPMSFTWPKHMEGVSSGQSWHGKYVETYVNGAPTDYAWLTYAENVVFFGFHGFVGALVFYTVWRWLSRADLPQPPVALGRGSTQMP